MASIKLSRFRTTAVIFVGSAFLVFASMATAQNNNGNCTGTNCNNNNGNPGDSSANAAACKQAVTPFQAACGNQPAGTVVAGGICPGPGGDYIQALSNSVPACRALLINSNTGTSSSSNSQECDDAFKKYTDAQENAAAACPASGSCSTDSTSKGCVTDCMKKLQQCNAANKKIDDDLTKLSSTSGGSNGKLPAKFCAHFANTACPEMNCGDTKDFRKELEQAQDQQQTLNNQYQQLQSQLQNSGTNSQIMQKQNLLAQQAAAAKRQTADNQAMLALEASKDGITQTTQGKINDLQTKLNGLAQQVNDAVAAQRAAADAVTNATKTMTAQCRDAAYAQWQQAQAALQAIIKTENGTLHNQNFTTGAGFLNRQMQNYLHRLSQNYAGYFASCMNGASPPGADQIATVNQAKTALSSANVNVQNQLGLVASERDQILNQAQQVSQNQASAQQLARNTAAAALGDNVNAYFLQMQANQLAFQQQLMADQQKNQQAMSQISMLGQQVQRVNQEVAEATAKLDCAQQNGGAIACQSSSGDDDDSNPSLSKALSLVRKYKSACETALSTCTDALSSATPSSVACNDIHSHVKQLNRSCSTAGDPDNALDLDAPQPASSTPGYSDASIPACGVVASTTTTPPAGGTTGNTSTPTGGGPQPASTGSTSPAAAQPASWPFQTAPPPLGRGQPSRAAPAGAGPAGQ